MGVPACKDGAGAAGYVGVCTHSTIKSTSAGQRLRRFMMEALRWEFSNAQRAILWSEPSVGMAHSSLVARLTGSRKKPSYGVAGGLPPPFA